MKITMDGKYAYRKDPYTQVRILCVDRPQCNQNVIALDREGYITNHYSDGKFIRGAVQDFDLVPLQEKLPDLWVVMYEDGSTLLYKDKEKAQEWIKHSSRQLKLFKYIPAPDQTS